jgi:hypothetical protein
MVVVATLRRVAFCITFDSDGGGALIVSWKKQKILVRNRTITMDEENRAQQKRQFDAYLDFDEDV